jgi:endonuclease G
MRNNLLHSFVAVLLSANLANAQLASGIPLPSQPSDNEMLSKEKDFVEKAKQLTNAESAYETSKLALIQSKLLQLGIPKMATASQESALQKHAYPGFLVGFSAEHGQPQWSYHAVERDIFDVCLVREEEFFEDLSLTGAPRLSQYRSSGFQRGHKAPAADFCWSPKASVASNTLSNIAPQSADLNEGLWAELEISARRYLQVRDSLGEVFVVTGPVLETGLKKTERHVASFHSEKIFQSGRQPERGAGFRFFDGNFRARRGDEKSGSRIAETRDDD